VPRNLNLLRLFTLCELVSLAVLLTNMAAGNSPRVAAAAGPVHGAFYLCVVIGVARHPRAGGRTTALALIPAVGGVLALRRLRAGDAVEAA
jgi:hypothetical protein